MSFELKSLHRFALTNRHCSKTSNISIGYKTLNLTVKQEYVNENPLDAIDVSE